MLKEQSQPPEIQDAFRLYWGSDEQPQQPMQTFAAGFRSGILARTRVAEKTWIHEVEMARAISGPATTLAKLVQDMHRHQAPPGERQNAALYAAERVLAAVTDGYAALAGVGASTATPSTPTTSGLSDDALLLAAVVARKAVCRGTSLVVIDFGNDEYERYPGLAATPFGTPQLTPELRAALCRVVGINKETK